MPPSVAWIFPVGIMVLGAGAVSGQNYPEKPIRILTTAVGGPNDLAPRLIADGIVSSLGSAEAVYVYLRKLPTTTPAISSESGRSTG